MATTLGPIGYQVSIPESSDTASIQAAIRGLVYNANNADDGSMPTTEAEIGSNSVFGILAPKASPAFSGTATAVNLTVSGTLTGTLTGSATSATTATKVVSFGGSSGSMSYGAPTQRVYVGSTEPTGLTESDIGSIWMW
jgi:hypothetical protein